MSAPVYLLALALSAVAIALVAAALVAGVREELRYQAWWRPLRREYWPEGEEG